MDFYLLLTIVDVYMFLRETCDNFVIIVVEDMKFMHGLITDFRVPLYVIID